MSLSVEVRGQSVATFRFVHVRLMEVLAAWVPTTPEMEVKLLFGEHLYYLSEHADWLGKRTHELRLPLQHSVEPNATHLALLERFAGAPGTGARLSGFYEALLPALKTRWRDYLERTDALMDGPTVRIGEHVLFDLDKMLRQGAELRRELALESADDAAWACALRSDERKVDSLLRLTELKPRPDTKVDAR